MTVPCASTQSFQLPAVVASQWRLLPRILPLRGGPLPRPAASTGLVDADLAEASHHVAEVLHRTPGGERREADQWMPDGGGIPVGGGAQVVESVAAVGGDGVEVFFGGNVVAAPRAPTITVLGGDASILGPCAAMVTGGRGCCTGSGTVSASWQR